MCLSTLSLCEVLLIIIIALNALTRSLHELHELLYYRSFNMSVVNQTKVITLAIVNYALANHKGHRQSSKPIKIFVHVADLAVKLRSFRVEELESER